MITVIKTVQLFTEIMKHIIRNTIIDFTIYSQIYTKHSFIFFTLQ